MATKSENTSALLSAQREQLIAETAYYRAGFAHDIPLIGIEGVITQLAAKNVVSPKSAIN